MRVGGGKKCAVPVRLRLYHPMALIITARELIRCCWPSLQTLQLDLRA